MVAVDPRNGEILALVSKPDFHLGTFSEPREGQGLADPAHRRAASHEQPRGPGPLPAWLRLQAGDRHGQACKKKVIGPDEKLNCYGIHWISTWPYRCWKEVGHGSIAMEQAITESCDIFIYQLGLRVKVERLAHWTRKFGFGEPSGASTCPARPATAAVVPDPDWKQNKEGLPWFPGNTVMMSMARATCWPRPCSWP